MADKIPYDSNSNKWKISEWDARDWMLLDIADTQNKMLAILSKLVERSELEALRYRYRLAGSMPAPESMRKRILEEACEWVVKEVKKS